MASRNEVVFDLVNDVNVLSLVLSHFIAGELRRAENPNDALRKLADEVHASIDRGPPAPDATVQKGVEYARDRVDKMMGLIGTLL